MPYFIQIHPNPRRSHVQTRIRVIYFFEKLLLDR